MFSIYVFLLLLYVGVFLWNLVYLMNLLLSFVYDRMFILYIYEYIFYDFNNMNEFLKNYVFIFFFFCFDWWIVGMVNVNMNDVIGYVFWDLIIMGVCLLKIFIFIFVKFEILYWW